MCLFPERGKDWHPLTMTVKHAKAVWMVCLRNVFRLVYQGLFDDPATFAHRNEFD